MRIKFFSSFLFMTFLLAGCESISLNKSYTEFYTVDGVGYRCEYIHGQKINCEKKGVINEEKVLAYTL